jgi:hypothetical protein
MVILHLQLNASVEGLMVSILCIVCPQAIDVRKPGLIMVVYTVRSNIMKTHTVIRVVLGFMTVPSAWINQNVQLMKLRMTPVIVDKKMDLTATNIRVNQVKCVPTMLAYTLLARTLMVLLKMHMYASVEQAFVILQMGFIAVGRHAVKTHLTRVYLTKTTTKNAHVWLATNTSIVQ